MITVTQPLYSNSIIFSFAWLPVEETCHFSLGLFSAALFSKREFVKHFRDKILSVFLSVADNL